MARKQWVADWRDVDGNRKRKTFLTRSAAVAAERAGRAAALRARAARLEVKAQKAGARG